tara:strand:- start:1167 stop:1421 length:255 start_codon:yes stop_codon:yes gene_type:complete
MLSLYIYQYFLNIFSHIFEKKILGNIIMPGISSNLQTNRPQGGNTGLPNLAGRSVFNRRAIVIRALPKKTKVSGGACCYSLLKL